MDNLQYGYLNKDRIKSLSFKPYYKWIIFNIPNDQDVVSL